MRKIRAHSAAAQLTRLADGQRYNKYQSLVVAVKSNNSKGNMLERHKLQINTLDAITIKRSQERFCYCQWHARRSCLCRCGRRAAILLLLLVVSCYYAANCVNKLKENASERLCSNQTRAWARNFSGISTSVKRSRGDFINEIKQKAGNRAAQKRRKRFLTFSGSGVVKFVLGVSFPIPLASHERSLSIFYNFQGQYTPPTRPIYWWSAYNTSTFAARHRKRKATVATTGRSEDESRALLYSLIENWLDAAGYAGEACLLHTICSVAQRPFAVAPGENGILHALLNAIFIPSSGGVAVKYLDAHKAGRFGADCESNFSACSTKWRWLERISQFI